MKLLTFLLSIFSMLAILPNATFAQTICTIEPGKGCGKVQLGLTKSEIKSVLGEGVQDSFTGSLEFANRGLVIKFEDSTDRVKTILFITNPKVWGNEKFSSFNGNLPKSLSLQTSPGQLIQTLANPIESNNFGEVTMIKYPSLEFGFRNNQLMYVEVSKSDSIASDQKTDDEEISPEEAKKQKEKLDSLKSNITFDSPKTPTPTPVPKSTPNLPPAPQKTGTLADCKFVLSDGCRNYFMNSTIDEVGGQLSLNDGTYNRIVSMQVYHGNGIELWVEPSSRRIIKAKIDRYVVNWKPSKELKWGEGFSKVQKKIGNGEYSRFVSLERLKYSDFTLYFDDTELKIVEYEQELDEFELAAKKKRELVDDQITLARDRADTAYANSPAGIKAAFDSMHSLVEIYANQANKKVEEFNKNQYIYESLGKRKEKEDEIYNIRKKGIDLITDFLTKYAGKLPKEMIDHLNEDLAKLRSDKGH